ncbi:MAG: type II secretion system protein [Candidatus Sungiibacteriota bacterium]
MRKKSSGFTLIELLVVISIIGLLSSIVLTSVNSARSKARNAREKVDVKQIITALELARSNNPNDKYPLSGGSGANWSCLKSSGTCWRGSYSALPAQAVADLAPYLPTLPQTAVSAPSGCYANDSYLYISNHPNPVGTFTFSGTGAFLIWAKETTGAFDQGECPGFDAGSYDCGLRYCYQYIGAN